MLMFLGSVVGVLATLLELALVWLLWHTVRRAWQRDRHDARTLGWYGAPQRALTGGHVPLRIRRQSRWVSWLWLHTSSHSPLNYRRAVWLARWLP